jgi:hypothetical protein
MDVTFKLSVPAQRTEHHVVYLNEFVMLCEFSQGKVGTVKARNCTCPPSGFYFVLPPRVSGAVTFLLKSRSEAVADALGRIVLHQKEIC